MAVKSIGQIYCNGNPFSVYVRIDSKFCTTVAICIILLKQTHLICCGDVPGQSNGRKTNLCLEKSIS